ncbi:MAG: c-type cytochrome [Janthinobacterium lividum]
MNRRFGPGTALAVLLTMQVSFAFPGSAQHMETSTFNSGPARPKEDPKVVAHGKQLYGEQCQSCHAADLRGNEQGPNILRSQASLTDYHGENLVPIMLGKAPGLESHKYPLSMDDANAVAAYVRSLVAQIGSQGRAPGDSTKNPNVLVGDATRGKQFFAAKCASCHSVDGDMKGIATRLSSPKTLQAAWIRGTYFGKPAPTITVTVSEAGKPALSGTLIHIDDFLVTLQVPGGSMQTVRRNGPVPKVVVKDPLKAHRDLLPTYTDSNIHDVTAYLVTLK